ncbi:hypothetical protein P4O66_008458, partial [Electrophorus voltai]
GREEIAESGRYGGIRLNEENRRGARFGNQKLNRQKTRLVRIPKNGSTSQLGTRKGTALSPCTARPRVPLIRTADVVAAFRSPLSHRYLQQSGPVTTRHFNSRSGRGVVTNTIEKYNPATWLTANRIFGLLIMRGLSVWTLLAVFSLVAVKGLGQNLSLLDALDDEKATPTPKTKPAGGPGAGKGISDLLEDKSTKKPPVLPKDPVKPKLMPDPSFDLGDALEPNDIDGKEKGTSKGGGLFCPLLFGSTVVRPPSLGIEAPAQAGGLASVTNTLLRNRLGNEFTDDDLLDVGRDDTYKPDKGKGGRGGDGGHLGPADDGEPDTMAETGTIAGIVSAVAMALMGAVSGYISYQKKKLCFSIQQSLNADVVKAENPEAVVAQEPQVQQTLLQPPNAEPPTEGNAV